MSKTPIFPLFMRQRVDIFALGGPLSAWDATLMASDLQWLIDMIPQPRCCWTALVRDEIGFDGFYLSTAGGDARSAMWTQKIAHTWIRADYPTGLDVCFAAFVGATGGDDLTLRVRIVPAATPVGDLSVVALLDETATTSGPNTTAVIESRAFFSEPVDQSNYFLTHSINEDGEVRAPRQGLLRVEVTLDVPEDDEGGLTEAYVREFTCQS